MKQDEVVKRLQEHCPDTWASLYRAHVKGLWRYAHRRFGGRSDYADEIVSETFMAAFESIEQFDPKRGTLDRWLFGIARLKIAASLRQLYRQRKYMMDDSNDYLNVLTTKYDHEETQHHVQSALTMIPNQQRDVLTWMYCDALSVREIAARINRTEKAAENLLYRARQRFKQTYTAILNEENTPVI